MAALAILDRYQAAGRSADAPRAPIDRVHLARYTMGNVALEIEVLGLFVDQAPLTLRELQDLASPKAWRDAAHTLKGSARAVGAGRVAMCAERAEALGLTADAQVRKAALDALADALAEARAYVEGLVPLEA